MRARAWNVAYAAALTACLSACAFASEGAAGGEGGGTIIEKIFRGGVGNAVITLIIFGVVVYILGTKAWPPLLRVLGEREQTIRESLEAARRERQEAEKRLAEYEARLDRARAEASAIVDEGRRDAEAVRRRIHEEARRESDEMIARARREIQLATDAAKKDVYDLAGELAVELAGRVIQKQLSAQDHRELLRESLESIRAGGKMN